MSLLEQPRKEHNDLNLLIYRPENDPDHHQLSQISLIRYYINMRVIT